MRLEQVLEELRSKANPKNVEGMARFGISTEGTLGISIYDLRPMAKRIGKDHKLAAELWSSGIHEAKLLAGFIDEPDKVTEKQMESWASDFDSWDVVDQVCSSLFDQTGFAHSKAVEWSERKEEFVKRAGFVLMAALSVHDKNASDKVFEVVTGDKALAQKIYDQTKTASMLKGVSPTFTNPSQKDIDAYVAKGMIVDAGTGNRDLISLYDELVAHDLRIVHVTDIGGLPSLVPVKVVEHEAAVDAGLDRDHGTGSFVRQHHNPAVGDADPVGLGRRLPADPAIPVGNDDFRRPVGGNVERNFSVAGAILPQCLDLRSGRRNGRRGRFRHLGQQGSA